MPFALITAGLFFVIWPNDSAWYSLIARQESYSQPVNEIARTISYWGDFYTGTLIITFLLWTLGKIFKKTRWRQAAIACLLAAAIAGTAVNCFRLTLGRPRPSANIADGFYGFQKSPQYHSFPSGHAATAIATSTALSVAVPPLAIPATTASLAVCWSRIYLRRHYPSDIIIGGMAGIFFGIIFALTPLKQSDS